MPGSERLYERLYDDWFKYDKEDKGVEVTENEGIQEVDNSFSLVNVHPNVVTSSVGILVICLMLIVTCMCCYLRYRGGGPWARYTGPPGGLTTGVIDPQAGVNSFTQPIPTFPTAPSYPMVTYRPPQQNVSPQIYQGVGDMTGQGHAQGSGGESGDIPLKTSEKLFRLARLLEQSEV